MGWSSTGPECAHCRELTSTCPTCTGDGRVTAFIGTTIYCPDCDGTGLQCPVHGADWK